MTATVLDFCAARRVVLMRELIDDFTSELITRFEFIANASDAELDEYEAALEARLSPDTRAAFGLAANDGAADSRPDIGA